MHVILPHETNFNTFYYMSIDVYLVETLLAVLTAALTYCSILCGLILGLLTVNMSLKNP